MKPNRHPPSIWFLVLFAPFLFVTSALAYDPPALPGSAMSISTLLYTAWVNAIWQPLESHLAQLQQTLKQELRRGQIRAAESALCPYACPEDDGPAVWCQDQQGGTAD